ncbi:MAG: hypothetical protein NC131_07115 [Roseburia sp.]|nr:hypothetical protein [Roseburia sp.]
MSKEQDFRKLIKKQNGDEKSKVWAELERQIDGEEVEYGDVLKKKRLSKETNILLTCGIGALILAVAVILICSFTLKKENSSRYCTVGDYYSVETETPIALYAEQNNLKLLYFGWYSDSEYCFDKQYKLNGTNEVICLMEELLDENEVYVMQYVTKSSVKIDFLEVYSIASINSRAISSVNVKYGAMNGSACAYFTYKDYNYYFSLADYSDGQYLLDLITDLLN